MSFPAIQQPNSKAMKAKRGLLGGSRGVGVVDNSSYDEVDSRSKDNGKKMRWVSTKLSSGK